MRPEIRDEKLLHQLRSSCATVLGGALVSPFQLWSSSWHTINFLGVNFLWLSRQLKFWLNFIWCTRDFLLFSYKSWIFLGIFIAYESIGKAFIPSVCPLTSLWNWYWLLTALWTSYLLSPSSLILAKWTELCVSIVGFDLFFVRSSSHWVKASCLWSLSLWSFRGIMGIMTRLDSYMSLIYFSNLKYVLS